MRGYFAELIVDLEALPVEFGDAPTRVRILLQFLQTILLLLLAKVKPEFQQQDSFVAKHSLEADDLIQTLLQVHVIRLSHDPIHNRGGIPGAEDDSNLALGWEFAPEAPHRRALRLFVRGVAESSGLNMARVHPFVE